MTVIDVSAEDVVVEMLQRTGSCSLDDLVIQLPNLSWSEIFGAIDKVSRTLGRNVNPTVHSAAEFSRRIVIWFPRQKAESCLMRRKGPVNGSNSAMSI